MTIGELAQSLHEPSQTRLALIEEAIRDERSEITVQRRDATVLDKVRSRLEAFGAEADDVAAVTESYCLSLDLLEEAHDRLTWLVEERRRVQQALA